MRAVLALLLSTTAAAFALAGTPASASGALPCPYVERIGCFTVNVALDRSGAVPGTIRLLGARLRSRRASRPPLIGLTGGPGQSSLAFAGTYDSILPNAGRDLVLVDQRGTGRSGLLRCRDLERRLGPSLTVPAGSCGRSLGARRAYYRSADSAEDLEALRVRIGAEQIALYSVSYGSRVALEYARRYSQRVELMILDSPVAIDGPDPLARETLGAVARVVRTACRSGCGAASAHPVADIRRLAARLRRKPIRRRVRRGRELVAVRVDADDLLSMLVTGDIDPMLMRAVPRAVRSALLGSTARLARLKLTADRIEGAGPVSEFSPAVFAATTCEESTFSWDPTADEPTRRAQAQAAIDATPAAALAPFDRAAAVRAGALVLCADWPALTRVVGPPPPLPSGIPTLVLAGDLDLRTPLETARQVVAQLAGARLVVEREVGHAVLGANPYGCARPAVAAFLARRELPACGLEP